MLITKNVFCSYTRHVPYKAFTYIYSFRWIKESMLKVVIQASIKNTMAMWSFIKYFLEQSYQTDKCIYIPKLGINACLYLPTIGQVPSVLPEALGLSSEQVYFVNLQDLPGNEQGRTILSTLTDTPFVVGIYQESVTVRGHKESRIP